jgi:serine/threonine protein kinase
MGVVYRATSVLDPQRTVALKVIREELVGDETQRQRFINEGRIIDSLDHPNIVKVLERGECNQRLYIAMEYLEGRTLAELVEEGVGNGSMIELPRCLAIMREVLEAMVAIHARGVVHRDIKPMNVILTRSNGSETVKLLDFGLAKLDSMTALTGTGEIVGTLYYMAPERIRHQESTAASDVFSFGVLSYELLTLERPFLAEEPLGVIRQLLEAEPLAPSSYRPELGSELDELVLAMLHKEPAQRPDGHELLQRTARIIATGATS